MTVLAFASDPARPVRVLEFTAPANRRRLKVTVFTAPPIADREAAARNPSYILVEDVGPAQ